MKSFRVLLISFFLFTSLFVAGQVQDLKIVEKNGKYGVVNQKGKEIVPAKYDKVFLNNEQIYCWELKKREWNEEQDKEWFEEHEYDSLKISSYKITGARLSTSTFQFDSYSSIKSKDLLKTDSGFIKLISGEYADQMCWLNLKNSKLSPEFERDRYTESEDYDKNGFVRVIIKNGWFALMDKDFNFINTKAKGMGFFDTRFPNARIYSFIADVKRGESNADNEYEIRYYNHNTKKIINDREYTYGTDGEDLVAFKYKKGRLWGFENYNTGEISIKPSFDSVEGAFSQGRCKVKKNNKIITIDKSGNTIK